MIRGSRLLYANIIERTAGIICGYVWAMAHHSQVLYKAEPTKDAATLTDSERAAAWSSFNSVCVRHL